MALPGRDDFDEFAGKIWQLKFCEEAAFRLVKRHHVRSCVITCVVIMCDVCTIDVITSSHASLDGVTWDSIAYDVITFVHHHAGLIT